MILLTDGMSRLFDLDWQLLADSTLMLIAIFVLFLIMSYFLFNPARKMLNARREKIQSELESAKQDMESSRKLREEYEAKLKDVDKEAEGILSEARIVDRSRVEAELEKQKMSDDVKKEIISVASLMAGKVVAVSVDKNLQNQLIDETLKEIGDKTWLN